VCVTRPTSSFEPARTVRSCSKIAAA
jgi:hypothetical protein